MRAHVFVPVFWQFVLHAFLVGCAFLVLAHLVYAQAVPRTWLPALWIPLGFALQSGLIVALAARCSRTQRQLLLGLDFLAWLGPLPGLLTASLGPATQSILLTLAIGCKLGVGLLVLHLAMRARLSDRAAAAALAGLALFFFLLTLTYGRVVAGNRIQLTGDEPHYLTVTASLLTDHDYYVDNQYTDGTFVQIYGAPIDRGGSGHAVPAKNGREAPAHDLGFPTLAVPFYAMGGVPGVVVAMAIAASLLVREVFLVLRLAGIRPEVAAATTALTSFSLPVVAYATQAMTEIPLALCVAFVLRRLLTGRSARWGGLSAGLALGLLPWLHVRAWPLVLPLFLTGWLVWSRWRDRLVLGAPIVILAGAYSVLIASVYGRVAASPLFFVVGGNGPYKLSSLTPHALAAAIADPWLNWSFGLLLVSPVYLLGLAGSLVLVRRGRVGIGVIASFACYASFVGLIELWGVGPAWAPPGRFMVACTPLLAVPTGIALERLVDRGMIQLVAPLIAWTGACAFVVVTFLSIAYTPGPVVFLANQIHVPGLLYDSITGKVPYVLFAAAAATVFLLAWVIRVANPLGPPDIDSEPVGIASR
jgi:hypothetical protein